MVTTIKLMNTSVTSHSYHCVYVCGEDTYDLLSQQISSTVNTTILLTIVAMLYFRSPELIYPA